MPVVRTSENNPFAPGSDRVPDVWAGRAHELADWAGVVRARRLAGQYERGRAIIGEPGIGKSVLARRIAREAAADGHLVLPSVRIPRGAEPLGLVAAAVLEAVESRSLGERMAARAGSLLDRIGEIRAGVTVSLTPPAGPARHLVLRDALIALGQIALEDGKLALVHIDEVQNVRDVDALSQLLVALGDAVVHSMEVRDVARNTHEVVIPLVVYLTGLRDFTDRATSAAGATFARRFKPLHLTHLEDVDVRAALASFTTQGWPVVTPRGSATVTMTSAAADALVGRCLGDPFLLQLLGAAAWTQGNEAVITEIEVVQGWAEVTEEATSHVERALQRLPAQELSVFETLVSLPESDRTLAAIADRLGRSSSRLGQAARRLEQRGVISRGTTYAVVARPLAAMLAGSWP